jgi:hypothetical protein
MCCGFEILPENPVGVVPGEMVEFNVGRAKVGNAASVWAQCVTLMRNQRGRPETAPQRAAHLFKSITGSFPRNLPDFQAVPDVIVSKGVLNKHKSNKIAFRSVAA